eukprot:12194188-Ditylum_brightwellii.AAC.1
MQLDYIVKHIQADTDSGKSAMCMLQWAQQCAGTATSILEDIVPLLYLEGQWINNLRDRLQCINGKLLHSKHIITPIQRENDNHIMGIFWHTHCIKTSHLKIINYCRYALKVELLSDIATTDGKKSTCIYLDPHLNY